MRKKPNLSPRQIDSLFCQRPGAGIERIYIYSNATEREQQPPSQNVLKSIHMPAIHVKNIRNFSEFHKKLIHLTGINDFSCNSTPSYLIIRANSHPAFATISI
jgi:hypothetical protein